MSTPFDNLVSKLSGVSKAKPNLEKGIERAITADCPGCGKARKLNVAETRDGGVLVNCYPCVGSLAPLNALGVNYSDLYPKRAGSRGTSIGGPAGWVSCASLSDHLCDKSLEAAVFLVGKGNDEAARRLVEIVGLADAMKTAAKKAMRNEYQNSRGVK